MYDIRFLILLLPVIVALFWFIVISLSVFKESRRKFALSFFMLSISISIFPGFLFFVGDYELYEKFYIIAVFFALSQFPAFYNFIVSLTSEKPNPKTFYLKHWIIPFVLTSIAIYVQFRLLSGTERSYFIKHVLTGSVAMVGKYKYAFFADKFFKGMFVLSAFFYFHLINKRVNNHEEQILDYFSNTDEISFAWFKIFRVTFFLAFISGVFYHSFDRSFHLKHMWMSVIAFGLLGVFYWVVGYFGNKQVDIYKYKYDADALNNKLIFPTSNSLDKDKNKVSEVARALDAIIKNKELYLIDNLTLVDLAIITKIDRNSISYIIKDYLKLNFKSYINQKRIKYAKGILSSNGIISKEDLYKNCGFKSPSTFCDVFREYTGETPTKFRNRKLLKENHGN